MIVAAAARRWNARSMGTDLVNLFIGLLQARAVPLKPIILF